MSETSMSKSASAAAASTSAAAASGPTISSSTVPVPPPSSSSGGGGGAAVSREPLTRQETMASYVTASDHSEALTRESSSHASSIGLTKPFGGGVAEPPTLLALPEHHPLSVTTSASAATRVHPAVAARRAAAAAAGVAGGPSVTNLAVASGGNVPAVGGLAVPGSNAAIKGRPGRSGSTSVAEARQYAFDAHPKDAKEKAKEVGERGASLKAWWKGFAKAPAPNHGQSTGAGSSTSPTNTSSSGGGGGLAAGSAAGLIFGVPLVTSLKNASVQISTAGPDGALYVWGYIPVVVAKCGLYLKEHATDVSGIFRVSGSTKRMKDLQAVFEQEYPDKYGKRLDWKKHAYGPHDVATILRRYLTQMPEPIVPCELYHEFRDALDAPPDEIVSRYKALIAKMPRPNQYLLLYVLDLLSVFAKKSEVNLMTASNLATIFQPGIIAHPSHAMAPQEHARSRQVLEFLIEHQDDFTVGSELAPDIEQEAAPVPPPRAPSPPPLPHADVVPSDSDDEAPAGGYVVHEGQFDRRHDELVRQKSKTPSATKLEGPPGGWLFGAKAPKAESTVPTKIVAVDNPPRKGAEEKASSAGGGLFRRRTAPTRRSEGTRRRTAAEAP